MALVIADVLNEVSHVPHVFQSLFLGEKSQRQYSAKFYYYLNSVCMVQSMFWKSLTKNYSNFMDKDILLWLAYNTFTIYLLLGVFRAATQQSVLMISTLRNQLHIGFSKVTHQ